MYRQQEVMVMPREKRDTLLQLRVKKSDKEAFKKACEEKGYNMSYVIEEMMYEFIRGGMKKWK